MKNHGRIRAAATASGVMLTLALAACGNSGSDAGSGSGGATAGDKTLIVGASVPLTGAIASAGQGQSCGVQIYFAAANAAGGVDGYHVNVEAKDNQYEAQAAATIAQEFVNEGAVAIFTTGTVPIDATRGATQSANVMLAGAGDGATFTPPKAPGEFTTYPRYQDDMAAAIDFSVDTLGEKKVSIVDALGAGDASSAALPDVIAASGAELGTLVQMNLRDPQWAAWAKQLADAGAGTVYVEHVDTTLAQLQKEAANIGYKPKWIAPPFAYGPGYLELAGDLAQGVYITQWAWPAAATEQPNVQKLLADAKAFGGQCAELVNDPNVVVGYNHAAVIGRAIEEASKDGAEVTGESMSEALNKINDAAVGTSDSMSFTADSHAGTQAIAIWQIQGDTLAPVSDWKKISN